MSRKKDHKVQATKKVRVKTTKVEQSVGYPGLTNNVNNCWFNATLQSLAHTLFGDWLTGTTPNVMKQSIGIITSIVGIVLAYLFTITAKVTGPSIEATLVSRLLKEVSKKENKSTLNPTTALVCILFITTQDKLTI